MRAVHEKINGGIMLEAVTEISHVNYSAIAERVVPELLEKSDFGKMDEFFSRISGLSGRTLSAALKFLPQSAKNELAVKLIRGYEKQIIEKANSFFSEKGLDLNVSDISVMRVLENIQIKMYFSEIDYKSLVKAAYPYVSQKLAKDEGHSKIFSLLNMIGGLSGDRAEKIIISFLDILSQEEKDDIAARIISSYKDEIITFINNFAEEKGLVITVASLDVSRVYPPGKPQDLI